ncbi:MAG: hypothetical protein LBE13_16580 [Bacteroidales bacterium]|jgi:hypothetical protein|nr:hypothetical protein [Bacteroidales bacterium]
MKILTSEVPLFDNKRNKTVYGLLLEITNHEYITQTSLKWAEQRQDFKRKQLATGLPFPEHSHWDWNKKVKSSSDSQTIFAIKYEDEVQGLMLVDYATQLTKLPPDKGKSILYIDYIESAPHNQYEIPTRFKWVGVNLLRVAVQCSIDKMCEGRIGLHALPQAENFYRNKCGLTPVGKDPQHQNLFYFEFTQKQSQNFLSNNITRT